jgi:hypothetical protein
MQIEMRTKNKGSKIEDGDFSLGKRTVLTAPPDSTGLTVDPVELYYAL